LAENAPQKNKWLAAEAKRVIGLTDKKWRPGMEDGKIVKTYHEQSINFALQ
jgi:hypothetical protein